MPLAKDVILTDIPSSLRSPKEYVRRVLENMAGFRREHGAAVVRIGTTGSGVAPHYRIQKENSRTGEFAAVVDNDEEGYFSAFHGSSHKKLPLGSSELRSEHWSVKAMTFEEVQQLLGSLRKGKPV